MSPSGESNDTGKKPKAGRVRHDSSGRAIWEWAADTGKHALDSTSRLLKRLDITGLTLADESKDKKEAGDVDAPFGSPREEDPLQSKRKSFNPYESRPAAKGAQKPAAKPAPKPIAQPRRLTREEQELQDDTRRGWFARLFSRK